MKLKKLLFFILTSSLLAGCDVSDLHFISTPVKDDSAILHENYEGKIVKYLFSRELDSKISNIKEKGTYYNVKTVNNIYEIKTRNDASSDDDIYHLSYRLKLYENTILEHKIEGTKAEKDFFNVKCLDHDNAEIQKIYNFIENDRIITRLLAEENQKPLVLDAANKEYNIENFDIFFNVLTNPLDASDKFELFDYDNDTVDYVTAGVFNDNRVYAKGVYKNLAGNVKKEVEFVFENENVAIRRNTFKKYKIGEEEPYQTIVHLSQYINGSNGDFDRTALPKPSVEVEG